MQITHQAKHELVDRHLDRLDAASQMPLHAHQREGVHWMADHTKGGIIADEPGLGKTRMLLAWLSLELRKSTPPRRLLVVTPLALLPQWEEENARNVRLELHTYAKDDPFGPSSDVTICTYGQLRINNMMRTREWTTVVFDEAHVMSPGSQMLNMALQMHGRKFLLTATPVVNTRADFLALLRLVGCLDTPLGDGVFLPDCVLRRERTIMPSLPPLYVHKRLLQPDATEASLHAALLSGFLRRRPASEEEFMHARALGLCNARGGMFSGTLGIQIAEGACASNRTVRRRLNVHRWDAESAREDYAAAIDGLQDDAPVAQPVEPAELLPEGARSAKLESIEQDLRATLGRGRRTLIFFRFREQCASIIDLLETLGVPRAQVGVIEGSVSATMRTAILQAPPAVLMLQIKVGSAGLNLSMYSNLFLACAGWTDAEVQQAISRVHRQGQKSDVHVFVYRLRNSMDTPQAIARKRKREMAATEGLQLSGGLQL